MFVESGDAMTLALVAGLPRDSRQVLVVAEDSPGDRLARVAAWEAAAGQWNRVGPPIPAVIGRNGFVCAGEKSEGDGCTPTGVYRLGLVFGSEPSAVTAMPYRQALDDDFWVDDPTSPAYNRWVKDVPPGVSCERLLQADGLYKYAIVVEYNTGPVIAGKGSAIFVHLWRAEGEPTAGCVAMAEADLLRLLSWLDPDKKPLIILGHTD